jgi:outer membrane protein
MKPVILFVLTAAAAAAQTVTPHRTLTLADAETMAIRNHPRVRAAEAAAKAAGYVTTQVRASYFPSLTANLTGADVQKGTAVAAGNVTTSSLFSRAASGIWANQLVTDFGRTAKLVESAQQRAGAQQENVVAARAQILLGVRQGYYRALLAQSVLRVAQDTVAARKLTLRQVSALAESNLKSSLDVSFAAVNLSEAELALFRAENDIRSAFADLAAALGTEKDEEYALVDESMPPPLEPAADALIAQAMRQRPELAGLRLHLDAARSLAESEKRLWLPTIGIIGTAGALPGHDDKLHSSYSGIGLNVSIPVMNGGLFKARRAEAEQKAEAVNQQTRELQIKIARDVKVAWLNSENAFRRLDVTARLLEQATRALKLAQARYDLGLSTIVELTQAQLNQTSAEIVSASARYEYQMQRSLLDYESGALR